MAAKQKPAFVGLAHSPASSIESADYFTPAHSSFLNAVFPRSKPLGHVVKVADPTKTWTLALDHDVAGKRTLYAQGNGFADINLRDTLVDLLDRADVELECDNLVVVLDKKDAELAPMLHSLLYVGGVVVPADAKSMHGKASSDYVLVGIDL